VVAASGTAWAVGTAFPLTALLVWFGIRWLLRIERRVGELRERVVWLEAKVNGKGGAGPPGQA